MKEPNLRSLIFLEELDINTLFDIKYNHNYDLKLFFIR